MVKQLYEGVHLVDVGKFGASSAFSFVVFALLVLRPHLDPLSSLLELEAQVLLKQLHVLLIDVLVLGPRPRSRASSGPAPLFPGTLRFGIGTGTGSRPFIVVIVLSTKKVKTVES